MDYDRKSTVSSFYGGRKSGDALRTEYPPQPAGYASRTRDDASSFFGAERASMDHLSASRPQTAGYNPSSFLNAGREEPVKGGYDEEKPTPEAWDVYADFNNAGPRYSNTYDLGPQNSSGYSQLPPSGPSTKGDTSTLAGGSKVEMVTVPAMGPEWAKEEMQAMTKTGRKKAKKDARKHYWKEWNRGERGLCGRYFTRRTLVFTMFFLCVAVGIILAFVIPRVPSFSFNGSSPLVAATGSWATAIPIGFPRSPANFTFPCFVSLEANTQSNFIPIHFNDVHASVFDLNTDRLVGTGDFKKFSLPAKSFPRFFLPLNFTYTVSNDSDITWNNWYNGCRNKTFSPNGRRPPVPFRLVLEMNIRGLPGTRAVSTQIADADCPVELPVNAP